MKIKVIFDSKADDKSLNTGWGLSFLIEENILFDTGEKGKYLVENLKKLNANIEKIKKIIISHDHWDHTGGLWDLLKIKNKPPVYCCPDFIEEFKEKVKKYGGNFIETVNFTELEEGIFTTGQIKGKYREEEIAEQSIVIKSKNGISIITGCAHPGVLKIIDYVKNFFNEENIYAVIGGFHLIETDKRIIETTVDEFRKRNIKKAGPTHCTGEIAIKLFKEKFKDDFIEVKAGKTIEM